jgi:membrane protein DedA with SNARE-associated domain
VDHGWINDLVTNYGYVIVALLVGIESIGVPVPGETALVAAALFASQGHLNAWGIAAVAIVGAVVGDNVGYWVGRRWGHRLTKMPGVRRIYDERRLAVADRFFSKHGFLAVFLGRFVALLRIFAGPLAGMHQMAWPRFLVANGLGAIVWVGAVVGITVALGDRALALIQRSGYIGLALVVLLAAALVVRHIRGTRREQLEGQRLLQEAPGAVDPDGPES